MIPIGDRSNIVIETAYSEDTSRVYLYSHWKGEDALDAVLHGLHSGRATDPSYLARIIFCKLVEGYEQEETGFGISSYLTDNEHEILVISVRPRETVVFFENEARDRLTEPVPADTFVRIAEDVKHDAIPYEVYEVIIQKLNRLAVPNN